MPRGDPTVRVFLAGATAASTSCKPQILDARHVNLYFVMRIQFCVLLALVAGAGLHAQTSSAPLSADELGTVYVRRFSAGATLSILPLPIVKGRTSAVSTTTPPVDALYTTTAKSQWLGWGGQIQLAVTNHFAVNAAFLTYRPGYIMDSDVYEGALVPNLPDTRRHTVTHEDTRARFYDVPVVVRWYNKDRHLSGPRFFAEGGASIRRVTGIRTSVSTSINESTPTCCDNTAVTPTRRNVRGIVAGLGFQLIDPIGIRVVPEVRYTRWNGTIFNSNSTATQRNQIEAMISLTF